MPMGDPTPAESQQVDTSNEAETLRRLREAGNRARRVDHLVEMLAVEAVMIAGDLNSELDDVLDTLRTRLRRAANEYTHRYL